MMPTPADQTTSPSPDQVLEQPQPSSTTEAQPEQPLPVAPEQPNPSTTTPDPTTTATTTTNDEDTTTSAIPPANTNASPSSGPALEISLMLITGARHPYRIDEKYLSSRNVTARNPSTGAFDPRELSGYQLKELILKDWRSEWEPKPASPSSIRLIIMGRMIEDKAALKDFPFSPTNPNVVHLSVKPAEVPDDDETAGKSHTGKGGTLRQREGPDRGAACRCVIL